MDAAIIAIALRDHMTKMENDMRKMELRINKLESEIIELKRPKQQQTTLENLTMRGAKYEQQS